MPISISGDPVSHERLVYTVRSVGQATQALVSQPCPATAGRAGAVRHGLAARRRPEGQDVLIVAGGIGLAPAAARDLPFLRHRDDYGRLVVLYGARSSRDLLYRKELRAWARYPDTQILATVDYGGLSWRGHVGVVTTLFSTCVCSPTRTVAMICGPEIMMRFVISRARREPRRVSAATSIFRWNAT